MRLRLPQQFTLGQQAHGYYPRYRHVRTHQSAQRFPVSVILVASVSRVVSQSSTGECSHRCSVRTHSQTHHRPRVQPVCHQDRTQFGPASATAALGCPNLGRHPDPAIQQLCLSMAQVSAVIMQRSLGTYVHIIKKVSNQATCSKDLRL